MVGVTNEIPSGSRHKEQDTISDMGLKTYCVWFQTLEDKFHSERARKPKTVWFQTQTTKILLHGSSNIIRCLVSDTF